MTITGIFKPIPSIDNKNFNIDDWEVINKNNTLLLNKYIGSNHNLYIPNSIDSKEIIINMESFSLQPNKVSSLFIDNGVFIYHDGIINAVKNDDGLSFVTISNASDLIYDNNWLYNWNWEGDINDFIYLTDYTGLELNRVPIFGIVDFYGKKVHTLIKNNMIREVILRYN